MIYKKIEEAKGLVSIDGNQRPFDIISMRDGWASCQIYEGGKVVQVVQLPVDAEVGKSFLTSGHLFKVLRPVIIK